MRLLTLSQTAVLFGNPLRLTILRELAKASPLPVSEISRRAGVEAPYVTKQMAVLRKLRMVEKVYNLLYQLAPDVRPAHGADYLDFGQCLLALHPPAQPETVAAELAAKAAQAEVRQKERMVSLETIRALNEGRAAPLAAPSPEAGSHGGT